MPPAGLRGREARAQVVFTMWSGVWGPPSGVRVNPSLPTNLHGEAGVAAVHVHERLLLVRGPLAVKRRRRWNGPVLGLGGGKGEVLPGVRLCGDGVGLGPRGGCLLLQT